MEAAEQPARSLVRSPPPLLPLDVVTPSGSIMPVAVPAALAASAASMRLSSLLLLLFPLFFWA